MKKKSDDAGLASGSGQINPTRAVHPGLIYDLNLSSYTRFLCKEGYNSTAIGRLIGRKKKFNCSTIRPAQGVDGLNYPSMHFHLTNESSIFAIFHRTVTNVGFEKSIYKATVQSPKGLSVRVFPGVLTFSTSHQTRSFTVLVKGSMQNGDRMLSALLEWSDTKHSVKSPIIVYKQLPPLF